MPPRLPDFLGIGASRSGTTALYESLRQSPDIHMSDPKEVHFFTFRHPSLSESPLSEQAYGSLFSQAPEQSLCGEISPSYLWFPGTAQRIKQQLGEIPLIILLRNPIERAYSDYGYSLQQGISQPECEAFFEAGLQQLQQGQLTPAPFHPSAILWKGFYAAQIQAYLQHFSRERLGIFWFDELIETPETTLRAIFAHLDRPYPSDIAYRRTNQRLEPTPMPRKVRNLLTQLYRPGIEQLARLLGRDLTHWLIED